MKTIKLFIAITLVSFVTSNAQITEGNWMVGGTGNFSKYENKFKSNNDDVTRKGLGVSLSPNIGYFLANKFVVGTNIGFGYTKPKDFEDSFSYGIGPFVRYYFLKEDNQINIFTQANFSFSKSKSGSNKSESNGYGIKAGSVIFFNSSVGLEISLDYNSSKLIPINSDSSSYNNLQISLGFQIHLEK